jgi:hypothetical protein
MKLWSYKLGLVTFILLCVFSLFIIGMMIVAHEAASYRVLLGLVFLMGTLGACSLWKNRVLDEELNSVHENLEYARITNRHNLEGAEATLKGLRESSAKETANFVKQLAHANEKLAEADKLADSQRESLEILNKKLSRLRQGAENAIYTIGVNVSEIRDMSVSNVSGKELKALRYGDLNAAHILFEALEQFSWEENLVPPSACRDFVVDRMSLASFDITAPWNAAFIRFAHRKENDAPKSQPSAT